MDFEYTLVFKKLVSVYKVDPPAGDYSTATWKEGRMAVVNCKVVAKGEKIRVDLLNGDESLFVTTPIPDDYREAVYKCTNSSRGYVLRVQNPKGGYLWLGLKFNDRNDGFDFFACIMDFQKNLELEKNPTKFKDEFKPTQDFSLQKGEKIKLAFGSQEGSTQKKTTSGGGFGLAPPPGSNTSTKTTTTTTFQSKPTETKPSGGGSDWGFDSWTTPTTNTSTKTNTNSGGFDSWDFGGSKPQQTQQQNDPFSGFSFGGTSQPTKQSNDPFGFGTSTTNTNTTASNQPKKQETVNLLDL